MKYLPIKHLLTQHLPTKSASIPHLSGTREIHLMTALPLRKRKASKTRWEASRDRAVVAMTNPNLISLVFLCIIVCLITANLILRVPDAGLTIEQFNQF